MVLQELDGERRRFCELKVGHNRLAVLRLFGNTAIWTNLQPITLVFHNLLLPIFCHRFAMAFCDTRTSHEQEENDMLKRLHSPNWLISKGGLEPLIVHIFLLSICELNMSSPDGQVRLMVTPISVSQPPRIG